MTKLLYPTFILLSLLLVSVLADVRTSFGLLLIFVIISAIIFTVRGETIIDNLSVVTQLRNLQETWRGLKLDLGKLSALQKLWHKQQNKDPLIEPTRIQYLCTLRVAELTVSNGENELNTRDRMRPICEVISAVSYPRDRLAGITFELRLYAGLLAILSVIEIAKKIPSILATYSHPSLLQGCRAILQNLGSEPTGVIAWVEVALLAAFTARLLSEISNLRQYTR